MEIKDSIELRDKGCPYCTGEEPKRIKHSYDDEDGMIATIRKSKNSLAHWLVVNFRGEQREFYIEFCPFCGKRLVPFNPNDFIGERNEPRQIHPIQKRTPQAVPWRKSHRRNLPEPRKL